MAAGTPILFISLMAISLYFSTYCSGVIFCASALIKKHIEINSIENILLIIVIAKFKIERIYNFCIINKPSLTVNNTCCTR